MPARRVPCANSLVTRPSSALRRDRETEPQRDVRVRLLAAKWCVRARLHGTNAASTSKRKSPLSSLASPDRGAPRAREWRGDHAARVHTGQQYLKKKLCGCARQLAVARAGGRAGAAMSWLGKLRDAASAAATAALERLGPHNNRAAARPGGEYPGALSVLECVLPPRLPVLRLAMHERRAWRGGAAHTKAGRRSAEASGAERACNEAAHC